MIIHVHFIFNSKYKTVCANIQNIRLNISHNVCVRDSLTRIHCTLFLLTFQCVVSSTEVSDARQSIKACKFGQHRCKFEFLFHENLVP